LVLGKSVGIAGTAWLAVRLGWGKLPTGVGWRHMTGASFVAGVGFTVSLFITGLAFADPGLVDAAKIGVLAGSILAGLGGAAVLATSRPTQESPAGSTSGR
jgi:NhaA family Na+:H+ antiporter